MTRTILVVDDSLETQTFLAERLLRPEGYAVLTAADGQEGFDIALLHHPDLIIAEHLMPNKTGLDMFASLRQAGRDIPMILVTAEGSEQLAVQARRLGVREYLVKPFAVSDLIEAVERILAAHGESTSHDGTSTLSSFLPDSTDFQTITLLKAFFEEASDAIIAVDIANCILFCNTVARRHFEIEDKLTPNGKPLPEIIQNTDLINLFTQKFSGEKARHYEIVTDNGTRVLSAHVTFLAGIGRMAIMRDITHIKAAEQLKNAFTRKMSQDIRSPLTTILSYAELLNSAGPTNERQQTFIDRIVFSVQSITALLSDSLELSHVEANVGINKEPAQLTLMVRYAIQGCLPQLEAKNQTLELDLPDRAPPVLGNPRHLRHMAQRILENASKYTPAGGTIRISLRLEDNFLLLRLNDTGIGVPVNELSHIFERFYRARNVPEYIEGTGLGLSIVQEIVKAHGGLVWAESQGENQGTTFVVILPTYRDSKT